MSRIPPVDRNTTNDSVRRTFDAVQKQLGVVPNMIHTGGGSPTGVAVYENGALGDHWRGLLLTCEAGRNVIFGYLPKPEGERSASAVALDLDEDEEDLVVAIQAHGKAKHGMDLKVPTGWDEYLKQVAYFSEAGIPNLKGVVNQGLRPDPIAMEWSNYLFANGAEYQHDQTLIFAATRLTAL